MRELRASRISLNLLIKSALLYMTPARDFQPLPLLREASRQFWISHCCSEFHGTRWDVKDSTRATLPLRRWKAETISLPPAILAAEAFHIFATNSWREAAFRWLISADKLLTAERISFDDDFSRCRNRLDDYALRRSSAASTPPHATRRRHQRITRQMHCNYCYRFV